MSTKPRNPHLLPALAAGLVLGAGASMLMVIAVDQRDEAQALDPIVAERIAAIQAEREWAGSVCGAMETWRTEIGTSIDSLLESFDITDPSATWDVANTAFGDARDATARMVEAIRAAEVPGTPSGRAFADGVDTFVEHARDHIEAIGLRVAAIGGDVGVVDGFSVPAIVDEVRGLVRDGQADIEALREPAEAMVGAMRATESCRPILEVLQLD